jgi:hypothetical protein
MPSCGTYCIIIRPTVGDFPPPTVLVRSTHRICSNCNSRSVSDYEHNFCYFCAPVNSIEFDYHHRRCVINLSDSRVGAAENLYVISGPSRSSCGRSGAAGASSRIFGATGPSGPRSGRAGASSTIFCATGTNFMETDINTTNM